MKMNRGLFVVGIAIATVLSVVGAASAATRTVTFRIKGMTCGGCAIAIEQILKSTDGVEDARVSYERAEAWVKYDDRKITAAKLRAVINGAGYQVVTKPSKGAATRRFKRSSAGRVTSCCNVVSCNT